MKPAICCVCGKSPASIGDGDWVKFLDYDKEGTIELSHPRGLQYFCNEHIKEARSLINLTSDDALNKLKTIHSIDSTNESSHISKKNWLTRWLKL